jgi:hypothetical protein
MKLSMLPIVERTVQARERVERAIAGIEDNTLQVLILGEYQDDAMEALVRPVVLAELKARLCSLDRDLVSYRVEVR